MLDFFENRVSYFQKCFDIWKGAGILKKKCHNRAKKFTFLRRFDHRNTFFLDAEKSYSKNLFSNDSECKTVIRG